MDSFNYPNQNYSYNYPYIPVSTGMDSSNLQNYPSISSAYTPNLYYNPIPVNQPAANSSMFNNILYSNSIFTVPHSTSTMHSQNMFSQPFMTAVPQSATGKGRKRLMHEYENQQTSDYSGQMDNSYEKRYNLRPRQSTSLSSSSGRKLHKQGVVNKDLQAGGTVSSASDPTKNIFSSPPIHDTMLQAPKRRMKNQNSYDTNSSALDLTASSNQHMFVGQGFPSSHASSGHSVNEANAAQDRTAEELVAGQTLLALQSRQNFDPPPYDYGHSSNFFTFNESSTLGRQGDVNNSTQQMSNAGSRAHYMNIDSTVQEASYQSNSGLFQPMHTEIDLGNIPANPFNTLPSTVPVLEDINFTPPYSPMFPFNKNASNTSNFRSQETPCVPQSRITRSYTRSNAAIYESSGKTAAALNNAGEPAKRSRTTFNAMQTELLEREFSRSNYCEKDARERLSGTLGVTEKQIKIWFQNRRMRDRKKNPAAYVNATGPRGRRKRKNDSTTIQNVYGTTAFSRAMEASPAPNAYLTSDFYRAAEPLPQYSTSLQRSSSASRRVVEGVQDQRNTSCIHGARQGSCSFCNRNFASQQKETVSSFVQKTAAHSTCDSSPEYLGEVRKERPSDSPCNQTPHDLHGRTAAAYKQSSVLSETMSIAMNVNNSEQNACIPVQSSENNSAYPKPYEVSHKNQSHNSSRKNVRDNGPEGNAESEVFSDVSSDNQDNQILEAQNFLSMSMISSQVRQAQQASALNLSSASLYQSSSKNASSGQNMSLLGNILSKKQINRHQPMQTSESEFSDTDFLNASAKGIDLSRHSSTCYSDVTKEQVSVRTPMYNLGNQGSDISSSNAAQSKRTFVRENDSSLQTYDTRNNPAEPRDPRKLNAIEKLGSACSYMLKSMETNQDYHQTRQTDNVQNNIANNNECKSINGQNENFSENFESDDSLHSLIIDETRDEQYYPGTNDNENMLLQTNVENERGYMNDNNFENTLKIIDAISLQQLESADFQSMPKLSPVVDFSKNQQNSCSSTSPDDFPNCPSISVLESHNDSQRLSPDSNVPFENQLECNNIQMHVPPVSLPTSCTVTEIPPKFPSSPYQEKLSEKMPSSSSLESFLCDNNTSIEKQENAISSCRSVSNSVSGSLQNINSCSTSEADPLSHAQNVSNIPEDDPSLDFILDCKPSSETLNNTIKSISDSCEEGGQDPNGMNQNEPEDDVDNSPDMMSIFRKYRGREEIFEKSVENIVGGLIGDSLIRFAKIKREEGESEVPPSDTWIRSGLLEQRTPVHPKHEVVIKEEPIDFDYIACGDQQQTSQCNSYQHYDANQGNQTSVSYSPNTAFSGSLPINTTSATSDIFNGNFYQEQFDLSSRNVINGFLSENNSKESVSAVNPFQMDPPENTLKYPERNAYITTSPQNYGSPSTNIRRSTRIKNLREMNSGSVAEQPNTSAQTPAPTLSDSILSRVSEHNPFRHNLMTLQENSDELVNNAGTAKYSCTQNGLKLSIKKNLTVEDHFASENKIMKESMNKEKGVDRRMP